jgi:hypothetical protein
MSRYVAFMLVILVAMSSKLPAQIIDHPFPYEKPIAELLQCEFQTDETCQDSATLGIVSGTWVQSDGTFNSTSATTAIATIDSYRPESQGNSPPVFEIAGEFWYRARMLNQQSGSSTRVGIVYYYEDAGNFVEVSFSPTGSVLVREVSGGVSTTLATGTYSGGGQNKWFDVEVHRTDEDTIVRVNGLPVVQGFTDGRTHGRVGMITRQTTGRFDRLLVMQRYGVDPEFRESFSTGAPSWDVIKGNWSVVNGAYQNSTIEYGSITLLPISPGVDFTSETQSFTVYARMLNPYGASGNRIGFVHSFEGSGDTAFYDEIVFGADGIARANRIFTAAGAGGTTNLIVTPRATAPYPFTRNQWFDVKFTGTPSVCSGCDGGNLVSLSVNGTPVFTDLEAPNLSGGLPLGLVTNFTPGRFDDVWFCHGSCLGGVSTETFQPNPFPNWTVVRGAWDIEGGVLNSRSVGANDIVSMRWPVGSTDYTLSARMLNPYGASGNRVGLIFNHDIVAGDYYEVVFATTGQAYLNKFIQGQLTQVATATHSAGRNVWFNVELTRKGPNATVKVNNQIVFQNVPTSHLDHSFDTRASDVRPRVGVISHWAPGRFDDLRLDIPLGR